MKAFITGSTGFIGCRLATTCRALGYEVIATGRTNTPIETFRRALLAEAGIDVLPVAVDDKAGLAAAVAGCDVVFHLAAAQHEASVPDKYFWDINVDGTRNVLEASHGAGVARFVLGSTIGVYGAALVGEIDDDTETRPDNVYEVTKLESERIVGEFRDRLDTTTVRISETYGPGDGRLLKLFKAIKKGAFFVIGDGSNVHQLIHVDDLVRGLLAAAERPQAMGEAFVLAGSEKLTTVEMCRCIADAMGASLARFRAPLWPFVGAAAFLEAVCRPLGVQPPLHRRRLDFFRKSFYFDTAKAARLLEFSPSIGFREGAAQTAAWYAAQGML